MGSLKVKFKVEKYSFGIDMDFYRSLPKDIWNKWHPSFASIMDGIFPVTKQKVEAARIFLQSKLDVIISDPMYREKK